MRLEDFDRAWKAFSEAARASGAVCGNEDDSTDRSAAVAEAREHAEIVALQLLVSNADVRRDLGGRPAEDVERSRIIRYATTCVLRNVKPPYGPLVGWPSPEDAIAALNEVAPGWWCTLCCVVDDSAAPGARAGSWAHRALQAFYKTLVAHCPSGEAVQQARCA